MLVYKATNSHNGKGYIGITCQALKPMANVQLKPPTPEAIASRTDALRRRAQAGIGVKVQPTEWPQIAARRANGETYKDIAADYGVRKETIFYFCKRHGGAA